MWKDPFYDYDGDYDDEEEEEVEDTDKVMVKTVGSGVFGK